MGDGVLSRRDGEKVKPSPRSADGFAVRLIIYLPASLYGQGVLSISAYLFKLYAVHGSTVLDSIVAEGGTYEAYVIGKRILCVTIKVAVLKQGLVGQLRADKRVVLDVVYGSEDALVLTQISRVKGIFIHNGSAGVPKITLGSSPCRNRLQVSERKAVVVISAVLTI